MMNVRRAGSIVIILILILSGFSLLIVIDNSSNYTATGTPIDSDITGHVTWTSSSSPYHILSSINITIGSTLFIDSDVEILFNGSYTITVEDGARLFANGSKGQEIVFSRNESTNGDAIIIQNSGIANFDWCKFENLTNGILLQGNIYNTEISNCSFDNCNKFFDLGNSKVNVTSTKFNGVALENDLANNLDDIIMDANSELFIRYFTNTWAVNGSSDLSERPRETYPVPDVTVTIVDNKSKPYAGKTDFTGVVWYVPLIALKIYGASKDLVFKYNPYNFTAQDKWYGTTKEDQGGRSQNFTDFNVSDVARTWYDADSLWIDPDLHIHKYFMFDYKPVIDSVLPSIIPVYEELLKVQQFNIFDNDDDDLQNNITINITDKRGNGITSEPGKPIDDKARWISYDYENSSLRFFRIIESPFTISGPDDYKQVVDETITINITDHLGNRDTETFIVEYHNVPDKPVVEDLETAIPYLVREDQMKIIQINVSDDDNSTSEIEITSVSPYVNYSYITSNTQQLELNFPNFFGEDDKIASVNITATDNCIYQSVKNEVKYQFTIQFKQTPDPPRIKGIIPDKVGTEVNWVPELAMSDYWSDPDPDDSSTTLEWYVTGVDETYFNVTGQHSTANSPLSFNWVYSDNEGNPGDLGGALNPKTISDEVRIWLVDQYGLEDYQDIYLNVSSTNQQPSLHKRAVGNQKVTVQPEAGDNEELYEFMIEYKDEDGDLGDAPVYVNVTIDNETTYKLFEEIEEDNDYSDGKLYYRHIALSPGMHTHYFECSDGKLTTRFPNIYKDPNVIMGPIVTRKIYEGNYKSDDGNFIAKIAYSGSDGTVHVDTPPEPDAKHQQNMGDIGAYFKINTMEMDTIEWVDITVQFGEGYSNYESKWLSKSSMKLAYLVNEEWKEFISNALDERKYELKSEIRESYGDQNVLTNLLSSNNTPIFTVIGYLDADSDGYFNDKDAFPFDPAAKEDRDRDGSPGKTEWIPGKGPKDSTSKPPLHQDEFPDDPAASIDSDGDGCPDKWNPGNTSEDSTSDPKLVLDSFLDEPAACRDTDGDKYPDTLKYQVEGLIEDTDDDNDGMKDHWEEKWNDYAEEHGLEYRFDTKNSNDAGEDWDGDGWNNSEEYKNEGNPFEKDAAEKDKEKEKGALVTSTYYIIIGVIIIIIILIILYLYTKMHRDQLLEHKVRGQIYEYIKNNSGTHYRKILNDFNLQMGVLTHHLNMLEQQRYIKSFQDGMYRRFYPMNVPINTELILSEVQERILTLVQDEPGISQANIARKLGLARKVVNYHIQILSEANFVQVKIDGRRSKCFYVAGLGFDKFKGKPVSRAG